MGSEMGIRDRAEGFDWIDFSDHDQSVIAFQRSGRTLGEEILFVSNFTPVLREGYRLGVPTPGQYVERLNTDADLYARGNQGNQGEVHTSAVESHDRPNSIEISLPPSRRSCSSTSRDPRILPGYKSPHCLDDHSHNGDACEPLARARLWLRISARRPAMSSLRVLCGFLVFLPQDPYPNDSNRGSETILRPHSPHRGHWRPRIHSATAVTALPFSSSQGMIMSAIVRPGSL